MSPHAVILAGETDWPGFRREARALLAQRKAPECIVWHTHARAVQDLFAAESAATSAAQPSAVGPVDITVPPSFIKLCETAILHSDPDRFGLLYRLLWRLAHEPALRHDPLDADWVQAQHLAKAVRRDMHKMTAFVRFRTLPALDGETEPLHVAWFEPFHHIVEAIAPFFVRRFTQMRWAIFTPERSVRWNGTDMELGPGGTRDETPPADAGEALWLTYYRHIFNPARLKLAMMQKEMPRKYWRNLPEAELIAPLTAQAMSRTGQMIDAPATRPQRRIAIAAARIEETAMTTSHALKLPDDPAQALAVLHKATDRCRECPIGEHATQSVFGEGPVGAALMVVGEQPGDQEDLQGKPFVGPAGKLFDRAVAQLGWSREKLYVTNAVKHFKYELRGKRRIHKTPGQREAAACLHWLESEIDQVQPKAFIALGSTAARALMGRPVAVMSEHGQWLTNARGQRVLVTLHPSALLRGDPAQYESAYGQWLDDLSVAGEVFGKASTSRR
jgi:DNA polymerase